MRRIMTVATLLVFALTACSGSGEPTATYTGGACEYDGPSEFDLDSTVTFTVINESDSTNMGFDIWSLPEGTTADEIVEVGLLELLDINGPDDYPGFYAAVFAPTPIDSPDSMTVTLDKPGSHVLVCFDETKELDHPLMFTVLDN
jgi:hypothetical protein